MFFRFGAAVALIVAVSLLGIALEKRTLALRRAISLQTYRAEQLEERRVQLRLRCEQLGAPGRTSPAGLLPVGVLTLTFSCERVGTNTVKPRWN